ncbi:MAG: replication protein RepA, partial [Bryobacteraceae bacterium]
QQLNVPIVSGFELFYPKDERQHTLWPSYVELSEPYYNSLIKHAVPLDYRAIAALQHNALAWMFTSGSRSD